MSISPELGERRTVDLPQGTVAYRERGEGPVILFVHGLLVNGDHWRKVVPLLADSYRCVCPDLPLGAHELPLREGADLSATGVAQLLADFIAALGLEDVTVVGNDTGDAFVQVLAVDHPERLGRIVLTPGDAFTNFLPWIIKPMRLLGYAPPLLKLVALGWRTRPGQVAFLSAIVRNMPPAEILDAYSRPPVEDARIRRDLQLVLRHAGAGQTMRAARALRSSRLPALVVWQKEPSPVFPRAHGRRLAETIPNARHEEVAGTRAFISEDRPDRLAELIRGFVPTGDRVTAAPA